MPHLATRVRGVVDPLARLGQVDSRTLPNAALALSDLPRRHRPARCSTSAGSVISVSVSAPLVDRATSRSLLPIRTSCIAAGPRAARGRAARRLPWAMPPTRQGPSRFEHQTRTRNRPSTIARLPTTVPSAVVGVGAAGRSIGPLRRGAARRKLAAAAGLLRDDWVGRADLAERKRRQRSVLALFRLAGSACAAVSG